MTSNRDLRKFQDSPSIEEAFSALVSGGRKGYKTIIERKKDILKCTTCNKILEGDEKFCSECGTKTKF